MNFFSTLNEKPSPSCGLCRSERVRSRGKVKPESPLRREGSGRVLGSTLKLTPRALARFLVSRLLVKGWGGERKSRHAVRPLPKYRLRVSVCDYDGRLRPDHATPPRVSFPFSSSFLVSPSRNTTPGINARCMDGGRERAWRRHRRTFDQSRVHVITKTAKNERASCVFLVSRETAFGIVASAICTMERRSLIDARYFEKGTGDFRVSKRLMNHRELGST